MSVHVASSNEFLQTKPEKNESPCSNTQYSTEESSFKHEQVECDIINDEIIYSIVDIINEIIGENIGRKPKNDSFYKSFLPQISIHDYIKRIIKLTECASSTLVISLIYIDKICQKGYILHHNNLHRIIFASVLLAIKFNEDMHSLNTDYAEIGGLELSETNRLEVEFINILEFELFVNKNLYHCYERSLFNFDL